MNKLHENDNYFRSVLDEAGIDYEDMYDVYRHAEDRSPSYHNATVWCRPHGTMTDLAWLDAAHRFRARLNDINREDVRVEFIVS